MIPATDLDSIRANAAFLYEDGVRGSFLNSRTGNLSDLYCLRAYLFSRLYRDPLMTEEEYRDHMNGFLKAFFGDGWQNIKAYIDAISEITNAKCTGTHANVTGMYDFDLVCEAGDKINAMWDMAEAAAQSQTYLDRIKMHRLSWTYLWQIARYEKDFTNGTDASREAYKQTNKELYEGILKYDVKWEGRSNYPTGELDKSPDTW